MNKRKKAIYQSAGSIVKQRKKYVLEAFEKNKALLVDLLWQYLHNEKKVDDILAAAWVLLSCWCHRFEYYENDSTNILLFAIVAESTALRKTNASMRGSLLPQYGDDRQQEKIEKALAIKAAPDLRPEDFAAVMNRLTLEERALLLLALYIKAPARCLESLFVIKEDELLNSVALLAVQVEESLARYSDSGQRGTVKHFSAMLNEYADSAVKDLIAKRNLLEGAAVQQTPKTYKVIDYVYDTLLKPVEEKAIIESAAKRNQTTKSNGFFRMAVGAAAILIMTLLNNKAAEPEKPASSDYDYSIIYSRNSASLPDIPGVTISNGVVKVGERYIGVDRKDDNGTPYYYFSNKEVTGEAIMLVCVTDNNYDYKNNGEYINVEDAEAWIWTIEDYGTALFFEIGDDVFMACNSKSDIDALIEFYSYLLEEGKK